MTWGKTIDIEDALRLALADAGWRAVAAPVPESLGAALPIVVVERTGGFEGGAYVNETHRADIDVYAGTPAESMRAACAICGDVRALAGGWLGGVPCYVSQVETGPYPNNDPRHPTLARTTIKVRIDTRTAS